MGKGAGGHVPSELSVRCLWFSRCSLEGLMTQDKLVNDLMVEEMLELKEKHGVPRRTMIKPDEGDLSAGLYCR